MKINYQFIWFLVVYRNMLTINWGGLVWSDKAIFLNIKLIYVCGLDMCNYCCLHGSTLRITVLLLISRSSYLEEPSFVKERKWMENSATECRKAIRGPVGNLIQSYWCSYYSINVQKISRRELFRKGPLKMSQKPKITYYYWTAGGIFYMT